MFGFRRSLFGRDFILIASQNLTENQVAFGRIGTYPLTLIDEPFLLPRPFDRVLPELEGFGEMRKTVTPDLGLPLGAALSK